jgi:GTP-binding protein
MLVDMPGYGFANISKREKGEWDKLITHYLIGRPTLKRVLMLIDARRGVLEVDESFMEKLDDSAVSYQIILTKCDALKTGELDAIRQTTLASLKPHAAAHPDIITTSAKDKTGIDALQEQLAPFAV